MLEMQWCVMVLWFSSSTIYDVLASRNLLFLIEAHASYEKELTYIIGYCCTSTCKQGTRHSDNVKDFDGVAYLIYDPHQDKVPMVASDQHAKII
jgi:hypothetical protein